MLLYSYVYVVLYALGALSAARQSGVSSSVNHVVLAHATHHPLDAEKGDMDSCSSGRATCAPRRAFSSEVAALLCDEADGDRNRCLMSDSCSHDLAKGRGSGSGGRFPAWSLAGVCPRW